MNWIVFFVTQNMLKYRGFYILLALAINSFDDIYLINTNKTLINVNAGFRYKYRCCFFNVSFFMK